MQLEQPTSHLAREYEHLSRLFDAQPALTRRFLEQQAAAVIIALGESRKRIRFQLPDRVILEGGESLDLTPAPRLRALGSTLLPLSRAEKRARLIRHLDGLEHSLNPGLAVCGGLFRFALASTMVHHLLPDGQAVHTPPETETDIPTIPVGEIRPAAFLAGTDAAVEWNNTYANDVLLQAPIVTAARRFYLPQWVAVGEDDQLLTNSLTEAEAHVASLQNAVHILQEAEAICPSVVADEAYQRKRAGYYGQLVNQGHALARYYTRGIIARIQARAAAGTLNRGLRLSLPSFEVDDLAIHLYPINIIPDGRIMFVPAFVAQAMQLAQAKIKGDMNISLSSRRHMLAQLTTIMSAFNGHSPQ
jgi:hypothetical protein